MIDLGTVKPGSTIRIPWSSFDKDDGSSITMTNYAAADILIYKDGNTTERASTSGFTATTDFDGKTGKHLSIIDLSDDTTADFFKSGSEYMVAIDAVTVDAVVTGGWIARFRIGYPGAHLDTTIATLSTQTSFTLTTGPAENSGLLGCIVCIHSKASAVQAGYGVISAYTGASKTVTLTAGVTFTAAAGDNISIFPPVNAAYWNALTAVALPLVPTTAGRTLDVSATGEAGVDWANVGSPTTSLALTGTSIAVTQKVDVDTIKTNPVVNAGTITFPSGATLASTTNLTAGTIATVSGNVNGSVGSVTGAVGSVTGAVGSVTGAVGSVTGNVGGNVVGTVSGVTPATAAQVAAVLTTQITEAYRANGAAPTLAQFMSEVLAHLGESSISGTTKTILKLDHSTTAETFTLDSAIAPASITRAT